MHEVLSEMTAALERGESAVFCCIISVSGSSPRKAGTKMAVFADGHTVGTVGGGRVEYIAAELAKTMLPNEETVVKSYDLEGKTPDNIGMVCGGAVNIAFRVFLPSELPLLARWKALQEGDEEAWIWFAPSAERGKDFCLLTKDAGAVLLPLTSWQNGVYTEKLVHAERVFLFGGGHVGRALVPVLSTIGFAVTLLDERAELAKPENYPCAKNVICADFQHIARDIRITSKDYVVVMTPGHRADFDILAQVIPSKPAYIGCMGSRRKAAAMRETLAATGFTEEEINRVHSPIGLPILSESPEEIAISIAAQMIEHRAKLRAAENVL